MPFNVTQYLNVLRGQICNNLIWSRPPITLHVDTTHDFSHNSSDNLKLCRFRMNKNDLRTRLNFYNINLLNSTGHVLHQQFNIQQLYILPTLY